MGTMLSNILPVVMAAIVTHVLFNKLEPRGMAGILVLAVAFPITLLFALQPKHATFLHMIQACFLFYPALLSSIVIYRISPFHPLAKYPGPLVCKISRLWAAFITYKGYQHQYYKTLHDKYGTHVRTGPNHLHICDVDAIQPVLGTPALPRGDRYAVLNVPGTSGSVIGIIDPHEHMIRRRIWNHGLSISTIQGYEGLLQNRISQLISIIQRESKDHTDLSSWLSWFSFDFMGDLAFGGAFKLLEEGGDAHEYIKTTHIAEMFQEVLGTIPWIRAFISFIPGSAAIEKNHQFSQESILARKRNGSTIKDIFYYLLDEEGVGEGPPSLPQLTMEAGLAIVAGSDTTGTALTNLFYYLICNPEAYARLRREIDEAFPPGVEIDSKVASELTYLQAVINETLRLLPASPSGGPRVIPRGTQGKIIAGRFVPPGTTVQITTFALHRDPRYYKDPEVFRPERWLVEDTRERERLHAAHIPFGYGSTNCVGKSLANLEMRMVVCSLVQKFEFSFTQDWDPTRWESSLTDYFILIKNQPLPVTIKIRD